MKKSVKLTYLKKAKKFLDKNENTITEAEVDELVIKAIKKKIFGIETNIDLKDLSGILTNKSRIRKGRLRIIIEIIEDEAIIESIIENIDFRGNVYK